MEGLQNKLKESAAMRWWALILVSLVMLVNYYFYDALSSIKSNLMGALNLTNSDYGFIVGFYAVPNLFMTLIGGVLLDRIGIRKTGFLFVLFMTMGAFITAFGASDFYGESAIAGSISPLLMMIFGRLFFGLGAETSIVVINKVMVKWFKGKNLALAFAINVALARVGTAAALILSPILVEAETGWTTAVWFAAMLVLAGLLVWIVYMMYDVRFDKEEERIGNKTDLVDDEDRVDFAQVMALFTHKSFLYVSALCVTFYSAVFPFMSYAPDLLVNKFGMTQELAGQSMSLLPFGTILFTPLFGIVIDKVGKAASMMIYGSLILLVVHFTFAYTAVNPYVPIVLLGIAFSLVPAAMWPSVAKLVKESQLGTAYGLMTAIQNVGLALFPILAGSILDLSNPNVTSKMVEAGTATYDYTNTMLMFAMLGFVGLLFSFLLKREDKVSGYGLERPSNE